EGEARGRRGERVQLPGDVECGGEVPGPHSGRDPFGRRDRHRGRGLLPGQEQPPKWVVRGFRTISETAGRHQQPAPARRPSELPMSDRQLHLLSPYRLPTSYPLQLSGDEVSSWLNGYAALSHPRAVAPVRAARRRPAPEGVELLRPPQPEPGVRLPCPARPAPVPARRLEGPGAQRHRRRLPPDRRPHRDDRITEGRTAREGREWP